MTEAADSKEISDRRHLEVEDFMSKDYVMKCYTVKVLAYETM